MKSAYYIIIVIIINKWPEWSMFFTEHINL